MPIPSIGNQTVTGLVSLGPNEVSLQDLLPIVDVSAKGSKNITVQNLSAYVSISGSTAYNAITAQTASYILGTGVSGTVISSSYSVSSSYSPSSPSVSSSYSTTSSYSNTSSYALNVNNTGSSVSSSYSSTSSYAFIASSAQNSSNLLYTGGNNGTASYAITTANVNHSILADTASYFNNTIFTVATASCAITAGSTVGVLNNYGVVNAYEQSVSASTIDSLTVSGSFSTLISTVIEASGDAILYFTSSVPTNYSLSLVTINRNNGQSIIWDSSSFSLNSSLTSTGSLNIPFNLIGQEQNLNGNYFVEVTSSSPNLNINTNRKTRFSFSSTSNNVSTQITEPMQFLVTPSSVTFSFSSSVGGPFIDYLPGILTTGSQNITWMNISNQIQGLTDIRYTWKCSSLTYLDCSSNSSLVSLEYDPAPSLQTLKCAHCNINSIISLQPNINLTYLDVSYNPLLSMPTLPSSLQTLIADSTLIPVVYAFGPVLVTASFSDTPITSLSALPNTLQYLNISSTQISSLPNVPPVLVYLNLSYAMFNSSSLYAVTSQLINNAETLGSLYIYGYGSPSTFVTPLSASLNTLQTTYDWTIFHD